MSDLWAAAVAAMAWWFQAKRLIEQLIPISHDALHVIVGVLAWLAIALLMRRSLGSARAWLWLFALIAWNETVDLWIDKWPDAAMQYGEGAKDLLLTMLLPTVMLCALRLMPGQFGTRRRS